MARPTRYDPKTAEPRIAEMWARHQIYQFNRGAWGAVYAIDTPPPSVSGNLHMGNVYSYCHTDFIARYRRMRGDNVFYPMGFDDNGLPSERLVERELGIRATEVGRREFIDACLRTTRAFAEQYRTVWQRLGLSVDWSYTYHTIDTVSRRTAQAAFLRLLREGRAYQREAPVIWCPECRTAIAQAEVDDLDRTTQFVTLPFRTAHGHELPVATTRPELLPACVAVFVHPGDERYREFVGQEVRAPMTGETVTVLTDERAQSDQGTGAVMCCTFGDSTDIEWWYEYDLPLKSILTEDGRLAAGTGPLQGLTVAEARERVIRTAEETGDLLDRKPAPQTVRVHERCGTPVEYLVTPQWFIKVLDRKEDLIAAGDAIRWFPPHMKTRYREWVENLHWDWLISRQRAYGVPFPIWYCGCGEVLLPDEADLPVDPASDAPPGQCTCGSDTVRPETDVMDTWATSSLTPQIAGRQWEEPDLYRSVFPMSLRPQAHEIIRTWAFYTIVQSLYDSSSVPWTTIMISGWGLAPEGAGKISKSKGGGPLAPAAMIDRYSADAIRYWAASTGTGKDAVISEEKMTSGMKLIAKLWNVRSFSLRFLDGYLPPDTPPELSAADRWILSALAALTERCTESLEHYDYAAAKNDVESFFWHHLADNYLEMAKGRLYALESEESAGARYTLHHVLLVILKLFAPFLPFISDAIYADLFCLADAPPSIHSTRWPDAAGEWRDEKAEEAGRVLLDVAAAVRRFKSERAVSLGAPLDHLEVQVPAHLLSTLSASLGDIRSVTRAAEIQLIPVAEAQSAVVSVR
jgi:valyl-tRNA synthetase